MYDPYMHGWYRWMDGGWMVGRRMDGWMIPLWIDDRWREGEMVAGWWGE
jgi:hypothetical protein